MNETVSRPSIVRAVRDGFWQSYLTGLMLTNTPRLFATLQRIPWYRQMLQEWATALDTDSRDDWLEVGCGPALLTAMLGQQGKRAIGLDHSASMLRYAENLPEISTANVSLVHGSAYDMPFENKSFDCVLAASLINVVRNPVEVIREMSRVTRSGGQLSCLVPSTMMQADNVETYIKQNTFKDIDAAGLRLWSSRVKKMSQPHIIDLMRAADLYKIRFDSTLDGMVLMVSAKL